MPLTWDLEFSKRMYKASIEEKFSTFQGVIVETIQGIKRGTLPHDDEWMLKAEELILEMGDRYFESDHPSKMGRYAPFITNAVGHIRQAAQMNGHKVHTIGRKELTTRRMGDITYETIQWLWHGHLARGKQEILSGLPGKGKSQIQCHFVACVTTGMNWPNGAKGCEPANCLMLFAEDSASDTVAPRLHAAGADLSRVIYPETRIRVDKGQRYFLLKEDLDTIEQIIREENVALLTIDPITAYLSGRSNSNALTDVRAVLGPLTELAERTNVAISTLTHPPKASDANANALNHFIGSQAFIAVARIGHLVLHDEANERYLFTNPKNNNAKFQKTLSYHIYDEQVTKDDITVETSFIKWDPQPVDLTPDQAIALVSGKDTKQRRRDKKKTIEEFLRENVPMWGNITAKDLKDAARAHGISFNDTFRNIAKEMGIETVKIGIGEGQHWIWKWKKPTEPSHDTHPED